MRYQKKKTKILKITNPNINSVTPNPFRIASLNQHSTRANLSTPIAVDRAVHFFNIHPQAKGTCTCPLSRGVVTKGIFGLREGHSPNPLLFQPPCQLTIYLLCAYPPLVPIRYKIMRLPCKWAPRGKITSMVMLQLFSGDKEIFLL